MKDGKTSQNSLYSSNSFFSDFSAESKYNGLVQKSPLKIAKNRLFSLMSYMDSTVPHFYLMHEVVTVWRFIQLIGATFCASYDDFWEDKSLAKNAIGIVSIFFHLIPPKYRFDGATICEFIYSVLFIVFFVLIFASATVYKKTAKLPKAITPIISVFLSTFMLLLHPVALNLCGEQISHIAMGHKTKFQLGVEVFAIILVIVVFLASVLFYKNIASCNFTFRPISFMTVKNRPSVFLFIISNLITFLIALGSHLSKIPQIVLLIISALLNFSLVYSLFMPGTYIRKYHSRLIFSASIGGGVLLLVVTIFLILNKTASQPQIFIIIAIFILFFIIGYVVLNKREMKQLVLLDSFIDNLNNADSIQSPSHMISILCTGMSYAHTICVSWDLFNYSTERWPEESSVWTTFAKFVSIYPEETNLLSYIIRNIITRKIKGPLVKETIMQATQIQMHRENTLSTDLKKKLAHVQKEVTSTKRKLRGIWDLVIQGNINEIEHAVNNAYKSANKTSNEYIHLITLYPNNRFVARSYARYLNEIVGDAQAFLQWKDKIRTLQRGIPVNADITNQMGLHAFPLLPFATQTVVSNQTMTNESNSFSTIDIDADEDLAQTLSDHNTLISSRINELKIPSIRHIRIISIFLFVVFMIAPTIAILVYATHFINSMTDPLDFMSYLSILRSYNFQLPLWAHHWINEHLEFPPDNKPMFEKPKFTHIPTTLGSSTDTFDQLKYLLLESLTICEKIGSFRAFETSDIYMKPVHDVMFEETIPYDNYKSINTSESLTTSLLLFYLDSIMELSSMTEKTPDFSMFNSSKLLNPYLNANSFATHISNSLVGITKYINEKSTKIDQIIRIVEIVACVVFGVVWILLLVYQLIELKRNKQDVYKCLISLPKNVVSTMSESMRVLKKDDNEMSRTSTELDTEMNKQEENLLKIFASAGDSTANLSGDIIVFSVAYLLMMAVAIIIVVLLCETFPKISKTLTSNTPHLDDVMGTTAYMIGIFLALNNAVIANTNGYNGMVQINEGIGGRPIISSLGRVSDRLATYLSYYHRARYGTADHSEPMFDRYSEGIARASQILSCENESKIYEDIHDTYSCFQADSQILLFEPFVNKFIQPILDDVPGCRIRTTDKMFIELWILACNLYDTLFYPMFDGIVPDMKQMMNDSIPATRTPVIFLVFVGLILTIIILAQSFQSESKMKFALKLLLHAQSKIVLQIPKISEILSGDFSSHSKDTTQRNEIFFQNVVQNLPDAVIIANQQFQVETCNTAFERIFHRPPLTGDVRDFFSSDIFDKDVTPILADQSNKMLVAYHEGSTMAYLVISCGVSNQHFIIIARDETQTTMYNTLIKEERSKSDQLLASILPANLVTRVQEGETNISFSVQSATVTFMDIVEFTPWCASNTAAMVMMSLNQLYKEFDAALAMKPTMTKIKCIGDCYMAAGGIFSEVNQPAVHSKEVVDFCLDCIAAVRKIDKEINQTLRIRAGVATGGPLVAGVLGTEKPTFEIIGPCINMAQQMEHNGVPMLVHISRSVYELIYMGDFVIKERGQIQIKNGTALTYLVESRKSGAHANSQS